MASSSSRGTSARCPPTGGSTGRSSSPRGPGTWPTTCRRPRVDRRPRRHRQGGRRADRRAPRLHRVDRLDRTRATTPTGRTELFVSGRRGRPDCSSSKAARRHDRQPSDARAPGSLGVGSAFHDVGVPQIGGIAGPTYLLVSSNGEMDKLDARARRQADRLPRRRHPAVRPRRRGRAPRAGRRSAASPYRGRREHAVSADRRAACRRRRKGATARAALGRLRGDRWVIVTSPPWTGRLGCDRGAAARQERPRALGTVDAGRALSRVLLRRHGDERFRAGLQPDPPRRGKVLERRTVRVR